MKTLKIFLIAGEISGDKIGGRLMHSLKEQAVSLNVNLKFYGIGGKEMIDEGLNLTHSMKNIGLIGLFEIIPHLIKLFSIIKSTAKIIDKIKPDIVVTIDSWDFCSRVVKLIKSRDNSKLVHYVSPTIWAYRKKRILQLEKLYDLLLCIFPFEPKYYQNSKLICKYIGHPITEIFSNNKKENFLRTKYKLNKNTKILGVMVGSREREVKKMLPIFIEAINQFISLANLNRKKISIVFPAINKTVAKKIASLKSQMNFNYIIIDISNINEDDRINTIKSFDLALTKSGTSSLELTFAKIPMVVAYKINYLSELMARYIFKLDKNIKYVSMTNIILNEPAIEEFLQHNCNPKTIANGLLKLLDINHRKKLLLKYSKVANMLASVKNNNPSDTAAKNILKLILPN
ncbi:MAG: lipid-A-disaccharide synthase [Rickettsiales bacterium]|nr:lipid-A-disaccharide synthase [Rickettsiales bacterium]